jgi:hypothetical protein
MSKPVADPEDTTIRRALLGFGLGAVGAIALVILIAYLRGVDFASTPLASDPTQWPAILSYAILQAAPLSPLWLDASIGFWVACIAISVQRKRRSESSGWESYF